MCQRIKINHTTYFFFTVLWLKLNKPYFFTKSLIQQSINFYPFEIDFLKYLFSIMYLLFRTTTLLLSNRKLDMLKNRHKLCGLAFAKNGNLSSVKVKFRD